MLLSYIQLVDLINQGVIKNSSIDNVNAASIDITLGDTIMIETPSHKPIDMTDKNSTHWMKHKMSPAGYILPQGELILAHSVELFFLPNNISAEYKLKSTMARNGIDHLNAGWCDAGWNNSTLTLELKNVNSCNSVLIKPGMKIGQMVFFAHAEVPEDRSYAARGSYNGDHTVHAGKGLK